MNKTSQLDAVNLLLSAINQSPVNSLDQTTVDVTRALKLLDEISREVQADGWKFNTEFEYSLAPNTDHNIVVADNVMSVDLDPLLISRFVYDVVLRGNQLFNRIGSTFTFTETLSGTVVILLDWDDLPEHARRYITLKARRQFQGDALGSDGVSASVSNDELQAFMRFKRLESNQDHVNFLDWHAKVYGWRGAR